MGGPQDFPACVAAGHTSKSSRVIAQKLNSSKLCSWGCLISGLKPQGTAFIAAITHRVPSVWQWIESDYPSLLWKFNGRVELVKRNESFV